MLTVLASNAGYSSGVNLIVIAGAAALAAIGTPIALRLGRRVGQKAFEREQAEATTLDDRLNRLATSIRESARLAEQVSAEVEVRAAAVRELEEKAKEAEALAALNRDQAEAVERLVQASMAGEGRRIRRDSVVIGATWFILGGAARSS